MNSNWVNFFSTIGFMPNGFLWLREWSDLAIALAYFAIPVSLVYFVSKRKELKFNWICIMFTMLMFACGITHIIEISTFWNPPNSLQTLVKVFSAVVSLGTVFAFTMLIPRALKYPSPLELELKNKELRELNRQILRSNESKLRQVFDSTPSGLLLIDQNDNIVLCNAQAEILFGYNCGELLGQKINLLVPKKQLTDYIDFKTKYFEMPRVRKVGLGTVINGLRKDGIEFPVELGLRPFKEEETQLVLVSVVDITERKEIEQKLHAAIVTRDDFISIASHELKTPLTSLSLQIQLIKRRIDPETSATLSREELAKIVNSSSKQVERLETLINDLMDASRIQAGKFSFKFERINFSDLILDMLGRFSEEFIKTRISIITDVEKNIVGTFDHVRLEQLLDNLLSNAIKYAPENPVTVSLKCINNLAILTVQDKGPGIPAEKQNKIFAKFERATDSSNITGLGLGLYIVKEIVLGHKGSIHLESEPGAGSKFIIELPLKRSEGPSVQVGS